MHWVFARIPIEVKKSDSGLYFATSPLIKGLLVSEKTEHEAIAMASRAIEDLGTVVSYPQKQPVG